MSTVRGDGVGLEVADSVLRGVRLRHDVQGRVAAATELPFNAFDDNAALDGFTLLRAELGEPRAPTRIATFPVDAVLQRLDVTGRSGPELNEVRANLDRRHGVNSTLLIDDGPRRWLVLIRWDAASVRRLEDLAERAGFVDVTVEPSPLALARVAPRSTTYVQRLVDRGDAHHVVVSNSLPVAAGALDATGRPHPEVETSSVDVPLAWFEDFLTDIALAELLHRVEASAEAHRASEDDDESDGAEGAMLNLVGDAYPAYPAHDIRSAGRQAVALGAAAGAAGLAGPMRPVDMIVPAIAADAQFDRPWAVERLSDLPDVPDEAPGTLKRLTARMRPRRSKSA